MYASDINHSSHTLQDKLEKLFSLSGPNKIDFENDSSFVRLLEKFGNPHLKLPPVIHVAGTNGKGSIIATLKAIYESGGHSVHTLTSPHLIDFNERIELNGQPIADDILENLIDEALELNAGNTITFFAITTVIAFVAFARTPADLCLIEVGLGGRLDSTNVIPAPALSIINAIGYDHMKQLGNTLPKITAEKAGIIKPNTPCVIGPQSGEALSDGVLDVFETKAKEQNAPLHFAEINTDQPNSKLTGPYQRANTAAVLKAVEVLQDQFPVSNKAVKNGLSTISWRARLQKLKASDYGLNESWELYLDGGHNADAGQALAMQAQDWSDQDLHIICGMMNGKDAKGFLTPLIPHAKTLNLVNITGEPQSQSPQNIRDLIDHGNAHTTYQDALTAIKTEHIQGRILICGSLYLAGQVLKASAK